MVSSNSIWIFCLLLIRFVFSFSVLDDPVSDPNNKPHVGSKLILRCISSSPHEHCTWKHNKDICRFDWNPHHDSVANPRCEAFGDRITFLGVYDTQECKIELKDLKLSDSGNWTCEMERKSGRKISRNTEIKVIEPPPKKNDSKNTTAPQKAEGETKFVDPPPQGRSLKVESYSTTIKITPDPFFQPPSTTQTPDPFFQPPSTTQRPERSSSSDQAMARKSIKNITEVLGNMIWNSFDTGIGID